MILRLFPSTRTLYWSMAFFTCPWWKPDLSCRATISLTASCRPKHELPVIPYYECVYFPVHKPSSRGGDAFQVIFHFFDSSGVFDLIDLIFSFPSFLRLSAISKTTIIRLEGLKEIGTLFPAFLGIFETVDENTFAFQIHFSYLSFLPLEFAARRTFTLSLCAPAPLGCRIFYEVQMTGGYGLILPYVQGARYACTCAVCAAGCFPSNWWKIFGCHFFMLWFIIVPFIMILYYHAGYFRHRQ